MLSVPYVLMARRVAFALYDFLLPPRCLGCNILIKEPHAICSDCWKTLNFIMQPFCDTCGLPFEIEVDSHSLCGRCIHTTPVYRKARAALLYDEGCKPLVLRFKHSDAMQLAPLFGKWMLLAGSSLLEQADYIVPVPLHWQRLFMRRYNQAALLALELGKLTASTVVVDMLRRHRATPPQGSRHALSRSKNVAGAFSLKKSWQTRLKDKKILLVDDVMTSGSTLNSCAAPLLKAGVKQIDVLTLARVV